MTSRVARRRRLGDDAGVTLVELLVSLAILSIAGVAILAGVQLSVKTSDVNRKQVAGGATARNIAEAIEKYVADGNYLSACGTATYAARIPLSAPSGYTLTVSAPQPLGGDGSVVTPCKDDGLQRLTVRVASTDGRATETLTLVLRKPS